MADIESILRETRLFEPSPEFVAQANVSRADYEELVAQAEKDYAGYWAKLARDNLVWHKPFTMALDESQAPFYKWFEDGLINASYNCLDRHLETIPNRTAIIFEADDGAITRVTYKQLYHRVCQLANGLKKLGVEKGDRVLVYLPVSVEAVVAMQACARIGAIHSVVFGGFSSKSVQERISDGKARVVITADGQFRGGKEIALKPVVDEALSLGDCESVTHVVVYRRSGTKIALEPKRDLWWHELVAQMPQDCEPTWVSGEHPLYILYTSGSTGRPKGVQHATAGYLLGAITSMKWVFDLWSHDDVARNSDAILERLRDGTMPCDGGWADEQIDVFQRWVAAGTPD